MEAFIRLDSPRYTYTLNLKSYADIAERIFETAAVILSQFTEYPKTYAFSLGILLLLELEALLGEKL